MQFIKEIFDPAAAQNETYISDFKLNYVEEATDLSEMPSPTEPQTPAFYKQRARHHYFEIKKNAIARDNIRSDHDLPITILTRFELAEHSVAVSDHVKLYKEKFAALVALDQKIMGAVLIAILAANIPLIPFIGWLVIPAWLAAGYFLAQRGDVYNEYQDSLTLLVGTCNWALGSKERRNTPDALSHNPQIKSMMDCLYPVLSKKQVAHLIADDIETTYTSALDGYDSRFKFPLVGRLFVNSASIAGKVIHHELEDTALKQRGAEFIRCVYGLNRGSAKDFLRVFVNALPDLWRATRNMVQAYASAPRPTEPTPLKMTPA